jgi:hypothetical protein
LQFAAGFLIFSCKMETNRQKRMNSTLFLKKFTLFSVLLLALVFSSEKSMASMELNIAASTDSVTRDPKKYYLKINAIIRDSKGPDKADEKTIKGVIIKVLNENDYLVASYFTDKKGKTNFSLPLDKKFKVLITKKGYVTKIVEINTAVPKEVNAAFIFPVDVAIFAEVKNLNTAVLNKPIAKVQFNNMQKEFVYDITYTHKINGELKKMYKEFYQLKKEEEKGKKKK